MPNLTIGGNYEAFESHNSENDDGDDEMPLAIFDEMLPINRISNDIYSQK